MGQVVFVACCEVNKGMMFIEEEEWEETEDEEWEEEEWQKIQSFLFFIFKIQLKYYISSSTKGQD